MLIYVLGASGSSSLDAYGYAYGIREGINLLKPHHLLYNPIGLLWVKAFGWMLPLDTLALLKLMNALFATAALLVLWGILVELKVAVKRITWLLLLAGSCWGVLRFATENETYIVPMVFSLLGSLHFIRATRNGKLSSYALSGLFASFATLVHQVMFFWWLALLVGVAYRLKPRHIVAYALPALIVPVAYTIAIYVEFGSISLQQLINYPFSDYMNGAANITLGGKSLLLMGIGVCRTVVQVHGYMANLLAQSHLWLVVGVAAALLVLSGLVLLLVKLPRLARKVDVIFWVHLLAAALNVVFATLSDGNAEFMAMLPLLLAILLSYWDIRTAGIALIAGGVLLWNVAFGVVPLKFLTLDGSRMVVSHIAENGNPCTAYILHDKPRIENEVNYRGCNNGAVLIKASEITSHAVDTLLHRGYSVFTDIVGRPVTYSRERLVGFGYTTNEVLSGQQVTPVCHSRTITGRYWLYRLIQ